jgi:hypothetical protein
MGKQPVITILLLLWSNISNGQGQLVAAVSITNNGCDDVSMPVVTVPATSNGHTDVVAYRCWTIAPNNISHQNSNYSGFHFKIAKSNISQ